MLAGTRLRKRRRQRREKTRQRGIVPTSALTFASTLTNRHFIFVVGTAIARTFIREFLCPRGAQDATAQAARKETKGRAKAAKLLFSVLRSSQLCYLPSCHWMYTAQRSCKIVSHLRRNVFASSEAEEAVERAAANAVTTATRDAAKDAAKGAAEGTPKAARDAARAANVRTGQQSRTREHISF